MSRHGLSLAFSTGFGALMVALAAVPVGPAGLIPAAFCVAAVLAGVFFRPAATVAVLLATVTAALSEASVLFVAASGLSAAAYLLLRHSAGSTAAHLTVPAALGLIGFTLAGVVAAAVPLQITWAPLLAPVTIAVILVLVALPLLGGERGEPAAAPGIRGRPAEVRRPGRLG